MLIDMNTEMPYYGYNQDFPDGDDLAGEYGDNYELGDEPETRDVRKQAFAVAKELSSNRSPQRESRQRITEAPITNDVRIGGLYADIAGDRDYATVLDVTVDPSTGNVTLELTDKSPGGGMDMRAGQVTSSRTAHVGRPDAHQLMSAIRDAINKDDILKRYGKPRKNFKWFADGKEIGQGMSQKLAKMALMSVHEPEKYKKKHALKPQEGRIDDASPVVVDITNDVLRGGDGDFRAKYVNGEMVIKGWEIGYWFSDYASETSEYIGDAQNGYSEYSTRDGGFAWKKISSDEIRIIGIQ